MSTETNGAAASPHLNSLLSKLRPFQRAGFEFAVHGTVPSDEGGNNGTKTSGSKQAAYAKRQSDKRGKKRRGDEAEGIAQAVAGAGTGRILLGDEMGLGYDKPSARFNLPRSMLLSRINLP